MEESQWILICDDDEVVHQSISLYLQNEGFKFESAYDGEQALKILEQRKPDLLLLDVMMPKMNGSDVCKQVRLTSDLPIIMLTARAEEIDTILGLELGADDYITKPFSPREVVTRIKAVLRRSKAKKEPDADASAALQFGKLEIQPERYQVLLEGKNIPMTPREVELLYLLASKPGRVYGRDTILSQVWGYDYFGETRTVDTHIKRLRQKLACEDPGWEIVTVYGVGYKFEVYA